MTNQRLAAESDNGHHGHPAPTEWHTTEPVPDWLYEREAEALASEMGNGQRSAVVPIQPGDTPVNLPPDLDDFLDSDEPEFEWLIEGVVEVGDRVILTGAEGGGKSTLLRQMAVQVASGVHPFTGEEIDPVRVLLIDTENSTRQVRRKIGPLRALAGEAYRPGQLRLDVIGQAIDLADKRIAEHFTRIVERFEPGVIVVGPLYKMTTGDPTKEEPARALADALDRLRAVTGSALLIEAHTPYAEGSKSARPKRPYGASLWSRWPEFGIFLGPDGEVEHWRGQRDERAWPTKLERGSTWPWSVATAAPEPEKWDGPTRCVEACEAFFADHPGEEFSTRRVVDGLRDNGITFRDATVADALKILAGDGRLEHRLGPRNANLYTFEGEERLAL